MESKTAVTKIAINHDELVRDVRKWLDENTKNIEWEIVIDLLDFQIEGKVTMGGETIGSACEWIRVGLVNDYRHRSDWDTFMHHYVEISVKHLARRIFWR